MSTKDVEIIKSFINSKPLDAFNMVAIKNNETHILDADDARNFVSLKKSALNKQTIPSLLVAGTLGAITRKSFPYKGGWNVLATVYMVTIGLGAGMYLSKNLGEGDRQAMFHITRKYSNWQNDPKVIDFLVKQSKS